MKKLITAFAALATLSLSACAHGGHHDGCCGGDECKMEKSSKSCCHDCCGDECDMKDKKGTDSTAPKK